MFGFLGLDESASGVFGFLGLDESASGVFGFLDRGESTSDDTVLPRPLRLYNILAPTPTAKAPIRA